MSASKKAKAAGLSSLAEAAKITGRSADLLTRWEKEYPELFFAVIEGCSAIKKNPDLYITLTESKKRK